MPLKVAPMCSKAHGFDHPANPQIVLIGGVCCCFYCASRFKELIFLLKLFLFCPYCILEEILFLTKIIALFANSFAYFGAGIARHNSQKY